MSRKSFRGRPRLVRGEASGERFDRELRQNMIPEAPGPGALQGLSYEIKRILAVWPPCTPMLCRCSGTAGILQVL
jgi:hypothetical protein